MKQFLTVILLIGLASCSFPQNPPAFKKAIQDSSLGQVERYTVPLPFETLIAKIYPQVNRCLSYSNGGILSSHGVVAPAHSATANMVRQGPGFAQIIVRHKLEGGINISIDYPEEGQFIFVADIKAAGPSATEIVYYYHRLSGFGDYADKIRSWATTNDTSCHDGIF